MQEKNPTRSKATVRFERELRDLILTAFARGAAIDRTWEITVPVSDAPNWTIEITKIASDADSAYHPTLLDE